MFNNNKYYIMSEMLYDELTQVSGFTKLNGFTYQEHIIFIFMIMLLGLAVRPDILIGIKIMYVLCTLDFMVI